jgi:hypothetical protein
MNYRSEALAARLGGGATALAGLEQRFLERYFEDHGERPQNRKG